MEATTRRRPLSERERQLARTLRTVQGYFNLSNVKLGAAAGGIPTSTVRNKVHGFTALDAEEMEKFAGALGVPLDVLYLLPEQALAWLQQHPEVSPLGSPVRGAYLSSAA